MRQHLPFVSILIPANNEEEHIAFAIESALFQKTDFGIEVIIVDDASNDRTGDVARSYQEEHPNVKLIENHSNKGKGHSVRRAYNMARGKYVHILDADDIFSSWDKIQRQVDLLERRSDCFAVGHNTLFLKESNEVKLSPGYSSDIVFDYADCIRNKFYCHTSSYLFRRLEAGLPEFFDLKTMRGDTAFFFYHAFQWKKSVYVLRDVMSVYNIHGSGIWSGLNEEQKQTLNVEILQDIQRLVVRDADSFEYAALQTRIDWVESKLGSKAVDVPEPLKLEDLISACEKMAANVFKPLIRDNAFLGAHSLPFVDSIVETVGRAIAQDEVPSFSKRYYVAKNVVFLVSGFVPNGGGIFREVKEIIQALIDRGHSVHIISSGKIETPDSVILMHFKDPSVRYIQIDNTLPLADRIRELLRLIRDLAPDRIYPFITHHDVVAAAALQRGLGREIVFDFVYDHGLSLGLHNSSIDTVVTKNDAQASALAKLIPLKRLSRLQPFFTGRFEVNPYRPARSGRLVTASAAARGYKVESVYKYSYFDVVTRILKELDGKHVHFGPLSDEALAIFHDQLARAGVKPDRFVHVPWANDFGAALLEFGVDVFVSPFPVCSARIGIEVMSCGVPTINHRADLPRLPEAGDFVDPMQPEWETPDDLVATLANMDADRLTALSESARAFYCANNASSRCLNRFVGGDFDEPEIDHYPRFSLSDLGVEPFFVANATKSLDVFVRATKALASVDAPAVVEPKKFWHRTPLRRKVRLVWHNLLVRRRA